jgi:hypothetical protein
MSYKITRLDRRHNGYQWYQYSVSPNTVDRIVGTYLLNDARNWMWATYGPSSELNWTTKEKVWAWDTEHGKQRIYIKSDAELALFQLKFGG